MSTQTIRRRKVQSQFQARRYGRHVEVPSVLLAGLWLEDAGFDIGEYVTITVEEGRLVIEPETALVPVESQSLEESHV